MPKLKPVRLKLLPEGSVRGSSVEVLEPPHAALDLVRAHLGGHSIRRAAERSPIPVGAYERATGREDPRCLANEPFRLHHLVDLEHEQELNLTACDGKRFVIRRNLDTAGIG